jgi:hypothetical protein
MNIKIRDNVSGIFEKICKETEPSQLMEFFIEIVQNLYSDYERQKDAEVEKEHFRKS